jgi:hypothetical protein
MKRIAIALLAVLLVGGLAGCSWLCCDPCEGVKKADSKK